ncbi:DUF6894 family protein [Microvirga sp. CF3016]|uniref:DUF6894 family protein n=1 Tax=Microvirga sp. CF3016 TaxID=3110181 RepID=UPI003FA5B731
MSLLEQHVSRIRSCKDTRAQHQSVPDHREPDRNKRVPEMKCYFHLVSATDSLRDATGIQVGNAESAYRTALEAIHDLWEEEAANIWAGWALEATDATGTILFSISLNACDRRLH